MSRAALQLSAEERPLALRLRPDLLSSELSLAGVAYRVLHDPVTGKHFQLREEEFSLLSQLNGRHSLSDLCLIFSRRFAPQQIGARRLQAFLAQAYRAGLLLSEYAVQGRALWERHREPRARRLFAAVAGFLQWRIIRCNPRWMLDRLGPPLMPLFSLTAVFVWLIGLAGAIWIALLHRWELCEQLPELSRWLRSEYFLMLACSLLIAKSWHELGHALACRAWGVRCREIGVQLLFGVPCLYCDTTEAWRLNHKWKRMAIAVGGMYFEGWLAVASAVIFHFTMPGLIHDLSLHLLFVCTLGTLLVNANPLLRFDGYYIFADCMEIANLEARSQAHLRAAAASICFAEEPQSLGPFEQQLDIRLALFGLAMVTYRLVLLCGIVWALRMALIPAKLAPIADLLTLLIAATWLLPLLLALGDQQDSLFGAERNWRGWRVALPLLALFALFVGWVPLPTSISLPAVLEPAEQQAIYATVPGRLVEMVAEGTHVVRGEWLARLENHDLSREVEALQAAALEQELLVQQLEAGALNDRSDAGYRIPAARESLASILERLDALRAYADRLEVKALRDGIVLAPAPREERNSERELSNWTGTPLDAENRGAYLETGTVLCQLAEERSLLAMALIDQADAVRVRMGDVVSLTTPAIAPRMVGVVAEVARMEADERSLLFPSLHSRGRDATAAVEYFVKIHIEHAPANLVAGLRCRARISGMPETLWTKWRRWLERTLRFNVPASSIS